MNLEPKATAVIINWIIANRRGAAFKGYSRNKIYSEILESVENNVFRYTFDDKGYTGVVCGTKDDNKKHIYIYDILTTTKGALRTLLKSASRDYPDYELFGKVRARARHFKSVTALTKKVL